MYQIIIILTAGITGTIVMDLLNYVFSRMGLIQKVEINMIGRMTAGWLRGRFLYKHPNDMKAVNHEGLLGYLAHYSIGIGLAIPYILVCVNYIGDMPSAYHTIIYGISTTVASWFIVYPSMGFGVLGLRSPDGIKATYSSLANHFFYGAGLALGILVIEKLFGG